MAQIKHLIQSTDITGKVSKSKNLLQCAFLPKYHITDMPNSLVSISEIEQFSNVSLI